MQRLSKLHVAKHKNKTKGSNYTISDIKNHPETLSSNILEREMNASKIIHMKDNLSDSRNNNKTIDQFKELKELYKIAKHHKVFNSKSNKNTTKRENNRKLIALKAPQTSIESFLQFPCGKQIIVKQQINRIKRVSDFTSSLLIKNQ